MNVPLERAEGGTDSSCCNSTRTKEKTKKVLQTIKTLINTTGANINTCGRSSNQTIATIKKKIAL